MALLETKGLGITFGGLRAVGDFEITIGDHELVGLIGPNGAGKTTLFNLLTGVYLPTDGDVLVEGKSVVGLKPYQIVEKGLSRTFQNIRLFKDMTVLDNVKVAFHHKMSYGTANTLFRIPGSKYWKEEADIDKKESLR
jgi:branched-chain amino acid transport system ATP-binding protein